MMHIRTWTRSCIATGGTGGPPSHEPQLVLDPMFSVFWAPKRWGKSLWVVDYQTQFRTPGQDGSECFSSEKMVSLETHCGRLLAESRRWTSVS